jgi:hypothetical protein
MKKNSDFLVMFTKPIAKAMNDTLIDREQFAKHGTQFISENKDLPMAEFMEKAEKEFGKEVSYYERYYQFKHLAGIHAILKYFFVLSVVSIALAIIVLLSTIK